MSKFTKARRDAIIKKLRAGNWAKASAESTGIVEKTYYDWLKRGDAALAIPPEERSKEQREYANFRERVAKAEADFETDAVDLIRAHANMQNGGKEMRWILERRFPTRWGPKDKLDITSGGEPLRTIEVVRTVRDSEENEDD